MPVHLFISIFAAALMVCLASGIWLSLHLTALTALFHGKADIVASPKPPRAERGMVVGTLAAFGISLGGTLALQVAAIVS